ncbi:MAG: hypothetical protein M3R68_00005 [Acidobacteriota bacterium]|nr:hypothetical protein [Acidobacteriota bacterium]
MHPAGDDLITIRRHAAVAKRALNKANLWTRSSKSSALSDIGRGKGIVFSPDLSEPGNREFFQALGFTYFEDPDWHVVLNQLQGYNRSHPENPVELLYVQSHGTNGDALKLQNGNQPDAPRSYISPGGLLERLAGTGVRACLLGACNAGRLFRPENYQTVKAGEGNRLFEPATLGIINASKDFDPLQSEITVARRAESRLEVIDECHLSEFSPATRSALVSLSGGLYATTRIAVPEMLIQLLLNDDQLHLASEGFEVEKSKAETNENYREHLISRFLRYVNTVAANKQQASTISAHAD